MKTYIPQRARSTAQFLRDAAPPKPLESDPRLSEGDRLYQRAWARYTGGTYVGPEGDWEATLQARLAVLRDLVALGYMSVSDARREADGLLNAAGLPEDKPAARRGPKTWAVADVAKRVALHRDAPEPVKAPPPPPMSKPAPKPDRAWVTEVKALGACGGWEKELFGSRTFNDNAIVQHAGKERL
jgi:hypothetical protein